MTILEFPPVELADRHGLLAMGGDLEVDSLLLAYRNGIFPWPFDDEHLTWFAPPKRGVLFLENAHISRSLIKESRRNGYTFKIDQDFEAIISSCAELVNRGKQEGTWITAELKEAYIEFHKAGHCHCVGCYWEGVLAGGVYGVAIGRMFAAESMFYRRPNASKLALYHLIEHLKKHGGEWIDCQMMTPVLRSFGGVEIKRAAYMKLVREAVDAGVELFPEG